MQDFRKDPPGILIIFRVPETPLTFHLVISFAMPRHNAKITHMCAQDIEYTNNNDNEVFGSEALNNSH